METSQGTKTEFVEGLKMYRQKNVCNRKKTGGFEFLGFYTTLICS